MDVKTQKILVNAISKAQRKKVTPYNTTATVTGLSGGIIFVKFAGSDISTPVEKSSVMTKVGDIVDISVSHDDTHITGNRSDKAMTSEATQVLTNEVSETVSEKVAKQYAVEVKDFIAARYATIDTLIATDAEIENLKAENAYITELVADKASISQLTAVEADIQNLHAEYGKFETLVADELSATTGHIDTLSGDLLTYKQIVADELDAATGRIDELSGNVANYQTMIAGDLTAIYGSITELESKIITTDDLQAQYARIDLANIQAGSITTAMLGTAVVGTTQIADGSITNAKIVELTANKITAGTLSVERLEIRGSENSLVYALNNITGALQAQNVDTLNGEVLTPRTITADKIVANAITANEIASKTITANEIDVTNLFAQDITATGTIRGMTLVGVEGDFTGKITATSGKIGGLGISATRAWLSNSTIGSGGAGVRFIDESGKPFIHIQDSNNAMTFQVDRDGTVSVAGNVAAKSFSLSGASFTMTQKNITFMVFNPVDDTNVSSSRLENVLTIASRGLYMDTHSYLRSLHSSEISVTTAYINTINTYTLNAGHLRLPTKGGTWQTGMTLSNASIEVATQIPNSDTYHPILAVKSSGGHVWNLGGIKNTIGIQGYYASRTSNGTDWRTYWEMTNGTLTHTGLLCIGTNLQFWSDGEGGNIRVYSPNKTHEWQMDAYNGDFRLYHWNADTGVDKVWTFGTDGRFHINGDITISHNASADMSASSSNPKITFSENGTQPVHLMYTDYDSYRRPAGLRVCGGTSATPAWLEVEGNFYAGGLIHSSAEITGLRVAAGWDGGHSNSIMCSNWFRSSGQTGWYNESYGGGIYMLDTNYIRTYGGKGFYCDKTITAEGEIRSTSANALRCIYGNYGFILHNNGEKLHVLITNSGNAWGTFNDLRPLMISYNGFVQMNNLAVPPSSEAIALRPTTDNAKRCGSSSYRFTYIHATNGTIQTSDEREKDILGAIGSDYKQLFMSLEPIRYRWRYGDDRKVRLGLGAQTTKRKMMDLGITDSDIIQHDILEEPSHGMTDRYGIDYSAIAMMAVPVLQDTVYKVDEQEQKIFVLEKRIEQLEYDLNKACETIYELQASA